jgi:multiple sugar transport system permease protein
VVRSSATLPGQVGASRRPILTERRTEILAGVLFHLPALLFFATFVVVPIFWGLGLAFYDWDVIHAATFVGTENFARYLTDPVAQQVTRNSLVYSLEVVPLSVVISLFLALLLNARLRGIGVFRWLYFMPLVTSTVAVALVWRWIFNGNYGLVNVVFGFVLPQRIEWLNNEATVLHVISFMSIWRSLPVNIILFLAGLQDVPAELYEAAQIDGANRVQQVRFVTWPSITPTVFLVFVLQVIGSFFGAFDLVAVLTQGGPVNSSEVVVYYIYEQAFRYFQIGYASAIAFVLFVVVLSITLIQWRLQKYWVHY